MDVLDYSVPPNTFIELGRACAVTLGLALLVWLLRIAITRKDVFIDQFTRLSFLAFACFSAYAVLQEITLIGEPMILWRLPLLLLATAAMCVATAKRL